jgi:hypothetical protein
MQFYISTKIAQAHYKSNSNKGPGYLIRNKNKEFDWMPKGDFEKIYAFKLENGKSITDTDIDNFISSVDFLQTGKTTMLARATLRNGSVLVESHSYLNPSDFNKQEALSACLTKVHDKIRFLLTFLLQCTKVEEMPFYPRDTKPNVSYHPFP